MDLNKQIGPFPLKMWLIIGAGGVGIGYLVTRKSGTSASGDSTANYNAGKVNELSNKLTGILLSNEDSRIRDQLTNETNEQRFSDMLTQNTANVSAIDMANRTIRTLNEQVQYYIAQRNPGDVAVASDRLPFQYRGLTSVV